MKIVILRGGGSLRRRRHGAGSAGSTRERGVMAIGNGSGRWVLVNMSPGVAHQLDMFTTTSRGARFCSLCHIVPVRSPPLPAAHGPTLKHGSPDRK